MHAAALAILLETARQLKPWAGQSTLACCFFDLEEPPHFLRPTMGSSYFVQHCPVDPAQIKCAIILDLCGHDVPMPGAENAVFAMGAEFSKTLAETLAAANRPEMPVLMARNDRIGDMSDHHAFRTGGLPFVFLSCGWWEHYHAPTDTFERLNLPKMQTLSGVLTDLVRRLDTVTIDRRPPDNFLEIEARTFRRLTGMEVPADKTALDVAASALFRKMTW